MDKISGIILAGGKSSRMGVDKATLKIEGTEMLRSVIEQLDPLVDEILISSNHQEHTIFNKPLVFDEYKNQGPLAGIHASLKKSSSEMNIVLSCDIPYIQGFIIEDLKKEHLKMNASITIASCEGKLHPLCGVYSKNNFKLIQDLLNNNVVKMHSVLSYFNVSVLEFSDAYAKYFTNINSQTDINLNTK